jgi:hypothetical protein
MWHHIIIQESMKRKLRLNETNILQSLEEMKILMCSVFTIKLII